MPINVKWLNKDLAVIRWDMMSYCTTDTINQAVDQTQVMRQSIEEDISLHITLLVAAADTKLPLSSLTHVSKVMQSLTHDNSIFIRVGGSSFHRMLDKVFIQTFHIFGEKIRFCDTEDEALALIDSLTGYDQNEKNSDT